MMSLKQKFDAMLGSHYGRPQGIKGLVAGYSMFYQHRPENIWAVSLLDVQPSDHILEVGFGPGRAIQQIASQLKNGRVCGIDLSPTMVALARRRNAHAVRRGRVELRVGDVGGLPFADESFDKALSIHSWYFWPDPVRAVREVRRVLKPGGIFALTFMPSNIWPDPVDGYTEEKAVELLGKSGFERVRVERLERQFVAAIGVK